MERRAKISGADKADSDLVALRELAEAARRSLHPTDLARLSAQAAGRLARTPLALVVLRGDVIPLASGGWATTGPLGDVEVAKWIRRLGLDSATSDRALDLLPDAPEAGVPSPLAPLTRSTDDSHSERSSWRRVAIPGLERNHGWLVLAPVGTAANVPPRSWNDAIPVGDGLRLLALLIGNALDVAVSRAALGHAHRQCQALEALYETARDVTSQPDLDAVLQAILERARDLVGSQLAYLNLKDPTTGGLRMRATLGIRSESFRRLRVRSDDGFAGLAIRDRGAVYVRDILSDPRRLPAQEAARLEEGLRSVLAAPMIVRDEPIGVLYVANRHVTEFGEEDRALLCGLANIAAVAIYNAQLHEEQRRAVVELEQLSTLTGRQYATLRRSVSIHDQLTRMALEDRGIEAICGALARLVSNPVIIENPWFVPLGLGLTADGAQSEADLATPRAALDDSEIGPYLRRLASERRPIQLAPATHVGLERPRTIAPILAGGELLGYLTVVESGRTLEELDFIAIEHATTILALELVKRRAATAAEERVRGNFLDQLLRGDVADSEATRTRARDLGLDLDLPHRVIVARPHLPAPLEPGSDPTPGRWLEIAREQLQRAKLRGLVGWRDGWLVLLVPDEPPPGARAILERLPGELATLSEAPLGAVALGSAVSSPAEVQRSYGEAVRAHELASRMGLQRQTVEFDTLGVYRLLHLASAPDEVSRFVDRLLGPLLRYDTEHDTQLVKTLDAYLWHACQLQATARALFLHVHSLRYRLERIEKIAGGRLDDPTWRFDAQVALAALRFTADATSPQYASSIFVPPVDPQP
ncbi:MAG: GAF domain-containing protein [Chloroflexi bacterium]|nr:GAF domain-containing protein [Chloroflexota bacterium]